MMMLLVPFLGPPIGILLDIGSLVSLVLWFINPTATVSFVGIGPFDYLTIGIGLLVLAF